MKVFVSWSGQKSRDVAEIFRDWLPSVLHAAKPFVSSRDIRVGTRWQTEIATELDDTDFGLICVTRENQAAEWLNFEAGALAKSVDSSRVVPVAIDLSPAEIPNPLGQFQAIKLVREDVAHLLVSMNETCPDPIPDGNVSKALEKWWPDLEEALARVNQYDYETPEVAERPPRSDRDLLEEVLDSVRSLNRPHEPPKRLPESDRVVELLAHQLEAEGPVPWAWSRKGKKLLVSIPKPPSKKLRELAERMEQEFDVQITFRIMLGGSRDETDFEGGDDHGTDAS